MRANVLSLILAAVALGVAVFALTNDPAPAPARAERGGSDALEKEVAELREEIRLLKLARRSDADAVAPEGVATDAAPAMGDAGDGDGPAETAKKAELAKIVDAAVDKRAKEVIDEMRIKENKKPKMDVFAKMLELTPEQRAAAERVVVDGQRKVHEILNTPTAGGANLMEELVDIVAKGMAQPGKDHGWGPWFARIVSEKVPGTDITYAAHIETIKKSMNETFKRDWSKQQFREYEAWGVDPTEIEDVPGSPNEQLMEMIVERARRMGAEIPEDGEED